MKRTVFTIILALLAAGGFLLGQGHVSLPFLAALGGAAALVFLRRWPWWLGLLVFTATHTLALELAYAGTVPLPWFARLGVFMATTLPLGGIFLAQSLATARRPSALTALILPCGWAALEFLQGFLSPTGTWGSMAYGFVRPSLLPLAQLASVTGWIGLTFLVGWLASMLDLIVTRPARLPAILLVGVLAAIWIGGAVRLETAPAPEREISVLLRHGPILAEMEDGKLLQAHYLGWGMDDDQRARVPAAIARYQDAMLALVAEDLGAGVDLVAWAEVLGWLAFDEEPAWLAHVRKLVGANETTLALGMGVYDPTRENPYENKLLVVDADGELAVDYLKSKPTPGAWHTVGDGRLPLLATPWGRLSGAICFEFDFPRLMQQISRARAQVVLAPSFDDDRVRHMHSRMAALRAIEDGFTLVRPTAFGISTIVDPYGRVAARKDAYDGGGFVLRGTAPVYETGTLYPRVGDVFGYLCLAGFLVLALAAWRTGHADGTSLCF